MKSRVPVLLAALGFALTAALLFFYGRRVHDWSGQLALVLTALAAWSVEARSLRHLPVDFSTGFLFYLMLALNGDAVGAAVIMLAGYCIRAVAQRSHTADMLWLLPAILGLLAAQSGGHWPTDQLSRLWAAIGFSVLAAALMEAGSRYAEARYAHTTGDQTAARGEARLRAIRRLVILYAPLSSLVPPGFTWLLPTVAPLCWALQECAEGLLLGARPSGAEPAGRSQRRGDPGEEVASAFSRPLRPAEAFAELARLTLDLVDYRTVALIKMGNGSLEAAYQSGPEKLPARALAGRREPLLERAWQADRACRGAAAPGAEQRLFPAETQLVAVPVKPLGVVYFGREQDKPFSKAEASRLCLVVRQAAPALVGVVDEGSF